MSARARQLQLVRGEVSSEVIASRRLVDRLRKQQESETLKGLRGELRNLVRVLERLTAALERAP